MRRRMGELRKALARQEGGAAEGVPRAAVPYRDAVRIGFESLDPPPRILRVLRCFPVTGRPDRVGIVRKLRWGYTLKKDAPGAYRLDMTEARFKNSRFYVRSQTAFEPVRTHTQRPTPSHTR